MSPQIIEELNNLEYDRLYNSYDTGGLLNYYGLKCYVNSIGDLYDDETLLIGRDLKNLTVNIFEIEKSEKHRFDVYLIEKDTVLYMYLNNNPEKYELIYEDEEVLDEINKPINSYAIFKTIEIKKEL